jgi:uncharacterized membrane protein YhaH (DUF805 family)
MSFPDAVRSAFHQFSFTAGRSRRSEYWWFFLLVSMAGGVAAVGDRFVGIPLLELLALVVLAVPTGSAAVRRLHDTDRSGWWLLLNLVPVVGWAVVAAFLCADSQEDVNSYGLSPKYLIPMGYPNWAGSARTVTAWQGQPVGPRQW